MANWIDEAITAELRKDHLRAAGRRGLVARAQRSRRPRRQLYFVALARLGRRLELWGCRLQARYGVLADAGVVPAIGDHIAS